ncbi:MAG: hypothetical protein GYA34_15290 [Chloroflexi bacterium]|nr:hypothetical protein [Chloroflexota bacterium]
MPPAFITRMTNDLNDAITGIPDLPYDACKNAGVPAGATRDSSKKTPGGGDFFTCFITLHHPAIL